MQQLIQRRTLSVVCCAIVLGVMISGATAQNFAPSYPGDHAFCDRPGFVRVDRSAWYKNGVTVDKVICVLQYYAVCATVQGAQPCNVATGVCRDVEYAWDNATLNPVSSVAMARAPQVCANKGAYIHPELAVYAVAQPVLAFFLGFIAIILVLLGVRRAGFLPGLWILFTIMIISCCFLIFGVWYLNAYLAMLVTIAGMGMFASRQRSAILIGLLCIFVGLLWFTYQPGLGNEQHTRRLSNSAVDRYEMACNSFYKGYFEEPAEFKKSFTSPLLQARRYCLREYIAVELFFLFFIELLFLMFFAYGGYTMVNTMHDESE